MAEAKGHKFGQTLGDWCEKAIEPLLREFADRHGLYLDKKGSRPARKGKKVQWMDSYGNTHDLDYVLERGGSDAHVGTPVAFIESAWRRYTKHSRNKAQEIQGAIMPVRDRHHFAAPFMGCILAGVYTAGALDQLRSLGCHLLYFEYPVIVQAFRAAGVDASFDETTSDAEFARKQEQWQAMTPRKRSNVWKKLIDLNRGHVVQFMDALERAATRRITVVRVLPLHGTTRDCSSVEQAIEFIEAYREESAAAPLLKYEIQVRYDNGDRIEAQLGSRASAVEFLEHYRLGNWTPLS